MLSPGQSTPLGHHLIPWLCPPTNSCQNKPAPGHVRPKNDTLGQWVWRGQGLVPDPFSFSSRLKATDPNLMLSEGEKHLWSTLILHTLINLALMSWFHEMELRISKIKHTLLFFLFNSKVAPVHWRGSSSTCFPQAHFLTTWKISYTLSLNFPQVFLTDKLFFYCSL